MIILMGPAGSGKSVQGQMLVDENGWTWLSVGQLLREEDDPYIKSILAAGQLGSMDVVNKVLMKALDKITDFKKVILDGYPRSLKQAKWLMDSKYSKYLDAIVVVDVNKEELIKRLELRGRSDDNRKAINERLRIYKENTESLLTYYKSMNKKVAQVNGVGTENQVHDRIVGALKECNLV